MAPATQDSNHTGLVKWRHEQDESLHQMCSAEFVLNTKWVFLQMCSAEVMLNTIKAGPCPAQQDSLSIVASI